MRQLEIGNLVTFKFEEKIYNGNIEDILTNNKIIVKTLHDEPELIKELNKFVK